MPRSRPRRAIVGVGIGAIVLAVAVIVAAVQMERVHHRYGTWALRPGPHTPVIPFHGRNYDRAFRMASLPADVEEIGSAPSNGEIFSAPPIPGLPPTVLYVRYSDGTVFDYSLSGGP